MKNNIGRSNNQSSPEEQCCSDPYIDIRGGEKVCFNCGMVFGVYFVDDQRRAYSNEEVEKRIQNEPKWRDFGSRTMIISNQPDSKGNQFKAETKTLFNRLSKIQNSLVTSIERNFWEAKPKMKQLVSKINIPAYIYETAWKIYTLAARKKLTMGRSIEGFIAASLYAAIRIHELPRLLEEVCDAGLIPRKTVMRSLGFLLKDVLSELNLKYKPITVEQLIFKFGNDLELPMQTQQLAMKMLNQSFKKGMSTIGKDPKGFAASALYLAAKETNNRKTQAEVSYVAKITEVTLRTRVNDFKNGSS